MSLLEDEVVVVSSNHQHPFQRLSGCFDQERPPPKANGEPDLLFSEVQLNSHVIRFV